MQLQGLPAGNRTSVLWITRPVLSHWAIEAVADNLGTSSVYIIQYYIITYILTTLKFPNHNHDFHLLTTSVNAKYYY